MYEVSLKRRRAAEGFSTNVTDLSFGKMSSMRSNSARQVYVAFILNEFWASFECFNPKIKKIMSKFFFVKHINFKIILQRI